MKKNVNNILLSTLLLAALLFSSQQTDKALIIKQMMNDAVNEKVRKYKIARAERCRELILAEASRRADSIVIMMAKELRVLQDTVNRPIAPERPSRPNPLKPIDSTAASPLLPDTIEMN